LLQIILNCFIGLTLIVLFEVFGKLLHKDQSWTDYEQKSKNKF